jgi:hypothetical protein
MKRHKGINIFVFTLFEKLSRDKTIEPIALEPIEVVRDTHPPFEKVKFIEYPSCT